MSLQQDLEQTAERMKSRGGYTGQMYIREFNGHPCFEAETSLVDKSITQKYNPEYERRFPGRTTIVSKDIDAHEIDHHRFGRCKGFPGTLDRHVKYFYEPMAKVLLPKGFSENDVDYITNALEDSLLHTDLNRNEHMALEGITYFFDEVGHNSRVDVKKKIDDEDITVQRRKFTKFYEAHAKLNMYLWGNSQEKNLLKKFYTHDEKITEVLKNFIEKTQLRHVPEDHELQNISTIYAQEFSKLMEPGYAMPLPNHNGSGTKGKPKSDKPQGNIFDKQMRTKEYRKSKVKEAYDKGSEAPFWIDKYDALDLLYESLAQRLEIKAKTYTQTDQMPVSWFGHRQFDPEKDNLKNTTFGFDDNGMFGLKKKKFHTDIPIELKTRPESFPKMRFGILDSSDSMKRGINGSIDVGNTLIIPWGDKSKYHYALLGWYGFLEYLKANHLLSPDSVDLANFSLMTYIGRGLAQAKRTALNPQFHETVLDIDKINYFFEGNNNLIFSISDGEIQNWGNIKDTYIRNALKHMYFHMQIGGTNDMTEDLEEAKLHVFPVRGDNDLVKRIIDLTDDVFRKK